MVTIFQFSIVMNVILMIAFMMARTRARMLEKEINDMRRIMTNDGEGGVDLFAFWIIIVLIVLIVFVFMVG